MAWVSNIREVHAYHVRTFLLQAEESASPMREGFADAVDAEQPRVTRWQCLWKEIAECLPSCSTLNPKPLLGLKVKGSEMVMNLIVGGLALCSTITFELGT